MSTKNTISYLISTAAMVLFSFIACYMGGIINLFCGIFVSVLLGMQVLRYHYGLLFPSVSLVLLVPFFVIGGSEMMQTIVNTNVMYLVVYALNFSLPLVLMGLTLGFSLKLKVSFQKTILILTAVYLAGALINMKVLGAIFPEQFSLDGTLALAAEQALQSISAAYANQPELVSLIKEMLSLFVRLIFVLSPAIFTVISLLAAYLCFVIFKTYMKRIGTDLSVWPDFSELRSDKVGSVMFLVLFVASFLISEGLFSDAIANIVVILSVVFLFYGLAFLDWKLQKRGVSKPVKRAIVILIVPLGLLLFPFLLLFLVGVGVVDGMLDFRKRSSNRADYL